MAGDVVAGDGKSLFSSSKNLLILISGASLSSKEFVGAELQANLQKLCLGLRFYEGPSSKSLNILKEDRKIDGDLLKLIISLSKFMNLDELLCYDLLCEYLLNDKLGDDFSVNVLLSYDRHLETFMLQVWNFYRWERLYTLLCIKTILAHHRDQQHPYHDLFDEFLQLVDSHDKLEEQLYKQWDLLMTTVITIHKLDSHSKSWMTFLLQEQFELLQVFLVFFKIKGKSTDRVVYLLNSFIAHGFGQRQANSHLMNDSMKDIVSCIGYTEVLVLLENLHFHSLNNANDAETYFLKQDETTWNNVDKTICCLGSQREHGLLLLAWAVVRTAVLGDQDSSTTRTLAKLSQKLKAFSELSRMLKCSLFQGQNKIAVCSYSIVYTLLSKIVTTYEESSIDDSELLWKVIGDLLKNPVSAERFWVEGYESNLGLTVSTLLGRFPVSFHHSVNLLSKLSTASGSSAKKVLSAFQNLQYTALTFSSEMKFEETLTEDGCCLKLFQDYLSDGICIRSGCIGYPIADGKGIDVIQWQQSINGMQLTLRILQTAIQETIVGPVSDERLEDVICITRFIRNIIKKLPASYADLQPLIDKIFVFVQRLAEIHCFNKNMVTSFLKLAAAVQTKTEVLSIWRYIVQTGVLPKNILMTNKWNNETSSTEIAQSSINFILASTESVTGEYSTLLAFLNVVSLYANILVDEEDEYYLACVEFIANEIFPSYCRWWYSSTEQKESIAQLCLKTFHNILKFPSLSNDGLQRKAQKVVLSSLLHNDTGYSLLKLVCIGEEAIQLAIAKQTSWITKRDTGVLHTVKLALSVLNRLLVVWCSGGKESSPLIQSLCSDPVTAHIVMGYVNHRFDSRLATLGVQLLKQFSAILPISLFVCLGTDAPSFCRLLLRRLEAKVEDIRLKLAIFGLLETCVKFQPGITETFLECGRDEKETVTQPSSSCLNLALDILRNFKKDLSYTEELHIRTLSFLKTLWISRQSLAISDFKKCPDLWTVFVTTLFQNDLSRRAKADVCVILSEECLFKESDKKSSDRLIEAFDEALVNGVLPRWINGVYNKYIFRVDSMQTDSNNQDSYSDESEDTTDVFLTAWKTFFIIGTKKGILNVAPGDRKTIYDETVRAVDFLLKNANSSNLSILSEILLHMSSIWSGCFPNAEKLCDYITSLLCSSLLDSDCVNVVSLANMMAVSIKLLFGLIKHHTYALDDQIVSSWIRVSCDVLQLTTLSSDKNLSENRVDKATIRVVILTSNLLKLLIHICPKSTLWRDHLQRSSLINILLGFIVKSMRAVKAADGCCAVLQLLSCLSGISEICESVVAVGTVQTLSLPLTQLQLNHAEAGIKLSGNLVQRVTWSDVYKESIHLMTKLLHSKRHLIAEIVMDFASVHLTTFKTIPTFLIQNLDIWILDISLIILQFIHELSQYSSLWKLQTNSSLKKLVQITAGIGYVSIAFLLRPRLIAHLLGVEVNDNLKDDDQALYRRILVNDDNSKPYGKLTETFNKLLRMSYLFISIMCQFSPDLCELLADQGYDAGQWVLLLQVNFNTPAVDHITPPSFGTIISNVTVCLRILTGGGDVPASPAQNSASDTQYLYDRELVTCLMEKSLYFVLSQACLNLLSSQQPLRDKEVFKRELGAELMSCIQSRYLKRGSTVPSASPAFPSPGLSPAHSRSRLPIDRWPFLNLISIMVDSLFK